MPHSHFGPFRHHLGLVEDHLSESLFNPLHEFLTRPRKSVRSQMIEAGFELAGSETPSFDQEDLMKRAGQAIESLHAGTLIFDDAQEESDFRSGSLHMQIGSPLALNAGEWLSFFAYRLILDSNVGPATKNLCLKEITDCLLKVHQGQALDLSVRICEEAIDEVPQLCRQSLEWKSASLLELGLVLGARIAGCDGPRLESIRMLGREIGITHQMFEDLKCLESEKLTSRHLENLLLERPHYVWWLLAEEFPEQWPEFMGAIEMFPETRELSKFLENHPLLQKGRSKALGHQRWTFQNFAALGGDLTSRAFGKIESLAEKIASP